VKNAPVPTFAGISAPSFNFDTLIDGTRSTPFIYELDLSTARSFAAGTAVQIKITGNCMLIDAAPDVGNAYLIFEGVQDNSPALVKAPIYVQPGFVTRMPFANVYIANTAQPGKKLRIIYGVDIDFQSMFPARMATVEQGFDYQVAFSSGALMGANTTEQVFAPAANTNGAILWQITWWQLSATVAPINLIAKTGAAPASINDGDVIHSAINQSGIHTNLPSLPRPLNIAAGKGLWFFNSFSAQSGASRAILYTLL
jgi:hypothetical protein